MKMSCLSEQAKARDSQEKNGESQLSWLCIHNWNPRRIPNKYNAAGLSIQGLRACD